MATQADRSLVKTKTNPDLQKERDTATFDCKILTNILDGGPEKTKKRHEIEHLMFSQPLFNGWDKTLMDHWDSYGASIRKGVRLVEMGAQHGWTHDELWVAANTIRFDVGMGVHVIMFIPAIERLATDEQQARWLPLARSTRMIGTYAQTEMGHGTNLRKLEMTATYDISTQEFVLSTPVPSGMKFWPGSLGRSANHVLLLAQLKIRDQSCGMQAFLVPIRDMNTHEPLPGVEVGWIGPTVGIKNADNGFLILKNVRIPRTNMLMRYSQVTPSGEFIRQGFDKAAYGTMIMVRATIVDWTYRFCSNAATVATRYSAVRRQTELNPKEGEVQVLDFQTQQLKLFPVISMAFALYFAKQTILTSYQQIFETEVQHGNFASIPEIHSQSCCFKALSTELSADAVETCRRACGGHGYLLSSGVADMYLDTLGGVTFEGENTVLYQQTARTLLKAVSKVMGGEKVIGSCSYINEEPAPITAENPDLPSLVRGFQRRVYVMLFRAVESLQSAVMAGKAQHDAWNANAYQLVNAAKAHADSCIVENFVKSVSDLRVSAEVKRVMTMLCELYTLHRIMAVSGDFLETNTLSPSQIQHLRKRMLDLLPEIRPNAVNLVDAFDYHDETLCSAIGSYDGQAYTRLYERAQKANAGKPKIHPSFHQYIKPFQKKGISAKL